MARAGFRDEPVVQATVFGGPRDPFVLLRETVLVHRDELGRAMFVEVRRLVIPREPAVRAKLDFQTVERDPDQHAASEHA